MSSFFLYSRIIIFYFLLKQKSTARKMGRWWGGEEMSRWRRGERTGKGVGKKKKGMTETESKDKERERTGHNGTKVYTDKNSCGDSKTGSIMTRWEFSLTYMVLYCRRTLFSLHLVKFHKSWLFLFLFVLNSMFLPHVLLHDQQGGKVRWQNKSRDCHRRDSIGRNSHQLCPVLVNAPTDHNTPLIRLVCGNAAPRLNLKALRRKNHPTAQPACLPLRRQISTFSGSDPGLCSPVKSRCDTFLCASRSCVWIYGCV